MRKKLGIVMDAIETIHYKKDTSLALLFEAQNRDYEIYYFEQKNLFVKDGVPLGDARILNVFQDEKNYFKFVAQKEIPLKELDIILMRKDPPFDLEYIYTTYILELAEKQNVLVVNKPQSLRDCNEKFFTTWFSECCPPTLITREIKKVKQFFSEHHDIVCKPLEGMGGASVFRLKYPDVNASVVMEVLSQHEKKLMMAQKYIPEITKGDKRILMVHGKPIPFALARIPAKGELRGNLAAGATGVAQPLTERDQWICEKIGPQLLKKGLYFVGLDVIGDYLTEINITSPTCVRELDEQCGLNIAGQFFDGLD